ncbi:hypothetical protein J4W00_23375, partial [Escherichia coli]
TTVIGVGRLKSEKELNTHFAYKQTEIIHTPNNSCDLKYKSQEAILITRSTTGAGYKLSPTFHNVQK